jgi:hypothetical protein
LGKGRGVKGKGRGMIEERRTRKENGERRKEFKKAGNNDNVGPSLPDLAEFLGRGCPHEMNAGSVSSQGTSPHSSDQREGIARPERDNARGPPSRRELPKGLRVAHCQSRTRSVIERDM